MIYILKVIHYNDKNLSFRSCKISFSSMIDMTSSFKKKTEVKSELLTNIDILVVEKGVRGRISHAIH